GKATPPVFAVRTTDGKTITGTLESLGPAGRLTVSETKTVTLEASDWLTARRDRVPLPPYPSAAQVVFSNGDRVPLAEKADLKIAGNQLSFRTRLPVKLKDSIASPPLATVALIW